MWRFDTGQGATRPLAEQIEAAHLACKAIESVIDARPARSAGPHGALAEGHMLIEDVPGVGKTMLAKRWPGPSTARCGGSSSLPTCCRAISPGSTRSIRNCGNSSSSPGRCSPTSWSATKTGRPQDPVGAAGVHGRASGNRGRTTYMLESPFMVIATQNPIEMEGRIPFPRLSWTVSPRAFRVLPLPRGGARDDRHAWAVLGRSTSSSRWPPVATCASSSALSGGATWRMRSGTT